MFVFGLAVFTIASLLCGVATTSTFLIWARAPKASAERPCFATGLALIGQEFQGRERGKAIAAWGATVGGAVAVGPLIGGGLTSGLGWRWIFFVNLPVGIITFYLSLTRMHNISDPGATRLDVAGLSTFSGAMFLLVFGLIRGNADGWTSAPILSMFLWRRRGVSCSSSLSNTCKSDRCSTWHFFESLDSPVCALPPSQSELACSRCSRI